MRNIVHIINKRATRDREAAEADTHAPCWADSAHASFGSLDPRVIQESGLTHTFLLQVWSNRQAAAAPASSHSPTASSGKTDRTQTLLDVTVLKVEEEFKKKKTFKRRVNPAAGGVNGTTALSTWIKLSIACLLL